MIRATNAAMRPKQRDVPLRPPSGGMDASRWDFALSEGYSPLIENWFIDDGVFSTRKGYRKVGSNLASIASTLMPFEFLGTDVLLSDGNGRVINAFTGQILLVHGGGGSKMSFDTISNHLLMVNAVGAWKFDGINITPSVWTGGPNKFGGIVTHNERVFMWEPDSLDFYYSPVGAVTGPVEKFPLSNLGNIQGRIVQMASWTVDAGHGLNDVLVILTSKGDAVVYEGLDPGDANDWRLTGRYKTAEIIPSKKAAIKVGADLLVQTKRGIQSMSKILRQSETSIEDSFTRAVDNLYLSGRYDNFGVWQPFMDPFGRMLICNGEGEDGNIYQYVLCMASKVWVRFSNVQAVDWAGFDGKMYFVTKGGTIYEFWTGDTDEGAAIYAHCEMAGINEKSEVSVSMIGATFEASHEYNFEAQVSVGTSGVVSSSSFQVVPDGSQVRTIQLPVSGRGETLRAAIKVINGKQGVIWRTAMARMGYGTGGRRL